MDSEKDVPLSAAIGNLGNAFLPHYMDFVGAFKAFTDEMKWIRVELTQIRELLEKAQGQGPT